MIITFVVFKRYLWCKTSWKSRGSPYS